MASDQDLQKAGELLRNSKKVVVFSGAGMSVASGIPDFRSKGGLWEKFDPSVYASYPNFLDSPERFWELTEEVGKLVDDASPNPGHFALVDIEKVLGKEVTIITQNVDSLHTMAGSTTVLELHGHGRTMTCVDCKKKFPFSKEVKTKPPPKCESCNSKRIKPDMILFGEAMPVGIMASADQALSHCDLLIMVGSSLLVSPANTLPYRAARRGAKIVFVNLDETPLDELADVCIRGKCEVALPQMVSLAQKSMH